MSRGRYSISKQILCFALVLLTTVDASIAISAQRERGASRGTDVSAQGKSSKADPRKQKAMSLAQEGRYQDASKLLFGMSRSPEYSRDSAQIKYILGLMLYEMKLNQSAAFIFYDLVRQESKENPKSKYLRQALGKLAMAADSLDSDVLMKYAIKQVNEEEFPATSRDMLYYRMGEVKMMDKAFVDAAREFSKVRSNSIFYTRARYKLSLALTEAGELDKALASYEDIIQQTEGSKVTNRYRVSALLGKARVLYQKQNFDLAIEAYREVPRDTVGWHEALFESTWAMLRDGRFRSALSNFQSLHSAYYEDFYQPESLLLRAIVYFYVCRYEETEKVLSLFDRIYKPVQRDVRNILTTFNENPLGYYNEVAKVHDNLEVIRSNKRSRKSLQIPFIVAREILKEGDVRRTFNYLKNLEDERKRISAMPASWANSSVGKYSTKIVETRIAATKEFAGKQIRRHLILIDNELRDLSEQSGFLRFETLSGKKEILRKEIAGKGLAKTASVDEEASRSFYIQNGYEYWPFAGEYWLDEIGNYHFVGVKACE